MRLKRAGSFSLRVAPFCLLAAAAHAAPDDAVQDTFQVSASYSLIHDSNLFRLSKTVDAQSAVGRRTPAETIKAASAGLVFTKDYGLQHIDLNINAVNYDYQNFSYLSFSGINYAGALKWQLTPRIRGNVTGTRTESLNSFGDFRTYGVRNQRVEVLTRADGIYELDGAWQLTAGVSRFTLDNSATVIEQRSYALNSVDAGIKRVFSSDTEASYRLRRGSGNYTAVSFADPRSLPASFNDTENELRLRWTITGKSTLDSRVAYLQRKYDTFGVRDFSGVVFSSYINWGVTARTLLRMGVSRNLSDYQTGYSSAVTADKLSIEPIWQVKEKLTLRLKQEISRRNFSDPLPGYTGQTGRDDKLYLSRVSVDWTPHDKIDLSAWLQRDKRTSNFSGFDFVSNSVGLQAQISF